MGGRRPPCGPILVVEDDPAFAELVAAALESAGWDVLRAGSQREAVAAAEGDLAGAVLDVTLPDGTGYELLGLLRAGRESLPVIFVSGVRGEAHDRVAGLLLGADDYLAKPVDPSELVARLRRLVERRDRERPRHDLTEREHEVLELLAAGLTQAQIAERLVIASKTVGTHLERILAKLDVHSRAQAVAVAYRDGLIGR